MSEGQMSPSLISTPYSLFSFFVPFCQSKKHNSIDSQHHAVGQDKTECALAEPGKKGVDVQDGKRIQNVETFTEGDKGQDEQMGHPK